MSYSKDFREIVLSFIEAGNSLAQACLIFSVSDSSVCRWRKNKRETGSLERKARPKKPYKIDDEQLKSYFEENPDAYLSEAAEKFNVTDSAISKALSRLNITRKKRVLFTKKEMR